MLPLLEEEEEEEGEWRVGEEVWHRWRRKMEVVLSERLEEQKGDGEVVVLELVVSVRVDLGLGIRYRVIILDLLEVRL